MSGLATPPCTPCIVCGSASITRICEFPPLPVDTNRIWSSQAEACAAPKAPIDLVYCQRCGHLFNRSYNDDLVTYEIDYENSQIFSPRFRRYLEELADMLIAKHRLYDKRIVEIGGGRGEFVRMICDRGSNFGVNIGPSYQPGSDEAIPANIRFITDYYTAKYRDEPADMIVCRHVLEHFWGARELITTVREAVNRRCGAIVYFEVPNGEFIMRERAFWEFHYQHVSYFTKASLAKLFLGCGFEICELQETFAGQFLSVEARSAAPHVPSTQNAWTEHRDAGSYPDFAMDFRAKVDSSVNRLKRLRSDGRHVVAWGAGAKAVTFLNIVDPAHEGISHIVDISPRKTGFFVAGSGQEIICPSALRELRPDVIVLMNAVYRDEIGSVVAALGLDPLVWIA